MRAVGIVLVTVLLSVLGLCCGASHHDVKDTKSFLPGFNSVITQNGLNYGVEVALEVLRTKLQHLTIPNQSGDTDTISWKISNLTMNSLSIPSANVVIDPNVGLTIQVFGASGELSSNWWFQEDLYSSINGSGHADVTISNMYLSIVLSFGLSSFGYPTVQSRSVTVTIGSLKLSFSGSNLDFILDILKNVFSGLIKQQLVTGLEKAITSAIDNDLNAELATLSTRVDVSPQAYIDLQLVSPIIFPTNEYFTLLQHGEFYSVVDPRESPFSPSANLPTSPINSDMLQIYIDQFVPNSASYVFLKLGKLVLTINSTEVPDNSPIQFNTSSWKTLIPNLYTKYPNWLMQVQVYPLAPPTINFTTQGGFISGRGAVSVRVINPSNPNDIRETFLVGLNMSGDVKAAVVGNNITASITNVQQTLSLLSSNIGPVNIAVLTSLANYLVESAIIPQINVYLAKGIPIPTLDGVDIVNGDVSFGNGFLFIGANVKYTPTQK
eukprot:TRINITY_DN2794_c0_g1_i1.p1 TRINITY_DN2794_c0_g1~~TRINITY_DN2794_c0_g1_i1.p1  ORF type:complete len:494 (+),score=83.32 TRINITY_DN2794_c0_g1_i1:53-1534(+)